MDKLIKGVAHNGDIRIIAADTTKLVGEAVKNHEAMPTAAAAYGRMLTAASLMGSTLKEDKESITLQINGKGISKGILTIGKSGGRAKGYIVNPEADIPLNSKNKLDVSGIVGKDGDFTVIRDYGLKEPYVSSVPIYTGEIAEDLAYYFTTSEQTPSAVALGILVDVDGSIKKAGGFILQMLPGASEMVADILMYRLEEMQSITSLLEKGLTIDKIIEDLFKDMDLKILEENTPELYCDCSRETVSKAFISIGKKDLEEIKKDGKEETLVCHFCNKSYTFTTKDVDELLNSLD